MKASLKEVDLLWEEVKPVLSTDGLIAERDKFDKGYKSENVKKVSDELALVPAKLKNQMEGFRTNAHSSLNLEVVSELMSSEVEAVERTPAG